MGTNSLPPARGNRFRDPASAAVWAAISALDLASQQAVVEELQAQLSTAPGDPKLTPATTALREAAELLGHSPSISEYRALHAREGRERGWPPDGTIRTWLGGRWNQCLQQAQLELVADGDVAVVSLGAAFTEEELVRALRECAHELGEAPGLHRYLGWANRPDVRERPGRRPLSQGPFNRLGGYRAISLIAFGKQPRRTMGGQVRIASYRVTRDDCVAAIREVARHLGGVPRSTEYMAYREELIRETEADGRLRALPSFQTMLRKFGSWEQALTEAGYGDSGDRPRGKSGWPTGKPSPRRISAEAMIESLREAMKTLGEWPTMAAYDSWRAKQVEAEKLRGPVVIARAATICSRFEGWTRACELAQPEAA